MKSKFCLTLILPVLFCLMNSTLSGADFKKLALKGSVPLLYEQDRYSELTVLEMAVRGGKRGEGKLPGLAWTTFKTALEPHSTNALNEMIELGAGVSTRVYGDFTLITLRVLSEHFPKALELIRRSLLDPLFNSVRLDAVSRTRQHTRKYVMDSPDAMAYFAQLKAFFPQDPYHHNEYGVEEGLQKIRVADVKAHYQEHFVVDNVVMAVSTNLSQENIGSLLENVTEKLPQGKRTEPVPIKPDLSQKDPQTIEKERIQSLISTAWLIPVENTYHRMAGLYLKTLLADGVGSKLWALRSQKNLIYSVSSELLTLTGHDMLLISLRCEQNKQGDVERDLDDILLDLAQNGIDQKEFQQTRAMAQTTFFRNSENKEERCFWAIQRELYGPPCDFLGSFEALSQQIDLESFNQFLKRTLGEGKRSIVVVGPVS